MDEAQRATLAAHIRASTDPATVAALATGNHTGLAEIYNTEAAFVAWQMAVSIEDVGNAFDYEEVGNMTSANIERLDVFQSYNQGNVEPSRLDIREFFDDVFSGAAGTNTRASLLALWKEIATLAEEVLSTGVGSDASPATLGWSGTVTHRMISQALGENP